MDFRYRHGHRRGMTLELESRRLTLTPLRRSDIDLLIDLYTDPDVVRFAGESMHEDEIRRQLPVWTRRGANGSLGIWCVSDNATGEKLGTAALLPMPVDEDRTDFGLLRPGSMPDADIEIGFFLKPAAWGSGYATEACRRLVAFAFEESPLTEIVATHDPGNVASRRVLEKSGFVARGWRRSYGERGPFLAITREHWLASR